VEVKMKAHNKVLIVLYYYYPYVSGVSVCAKRVAEGLVKNGYKVTVLTTQHEKCLDKHEVINGVEVIRRPVLFKMGKGVILPFFWLDIIKYSIKNDYVNPNLPMAESGISSLFIPKRKIITTYQCDINLGPKPVDKLVAYVSTSLMRLQLIRSRVVVPSTLDYLEHSKMKKYIYKSKPIYPMVTADEFFPISPTPLFNKLGLSAKTIKIGFVGRIVYEKGIEYLLESIPFIQKSINNFTIIIVGDYQKVAGGSIKDKLDHYMELYPGKIIFTGFLSDEERNQFYSGIDVFVLPSIDPLEAYGMVQIEAMLCGSPVVASNLPGVREIVLKTGYGRISKIKNSKDIALQVCEIVMNPEKYKPERKRVVSIFDPNNAVNDYMKLMPIDGKV
jgi:glycosyltransferase involved in cell wall biosynthesis